MMAFYHSDLDPNLGSKNVADSLFTSVDIGFLE